MVWLHSDFSVDTKRIKCYQNHKLLFLTQPERAFGRLNLQVWTLHAAHSAHPSYLVSPSHFSSFPHSCFDWESALMPTGRCLSPRLVDSWASLEHHSFVHVLEVLDHLDAHALRRYARWPFRHRAMRRMGHLP